MAQYPEIAGFRLLEADEASFAMGGADKKAQDALYTIGYVIGIVVKFISNLFAISGKKIA